ncbi:MAG: hypothetical protein ACI38Y_05860 [Candidatus Methanomethylophilaceae archaeon]
MEAHKDISEMSFEEFFSEPKTKAERKDSAKAVPPNESRRTAESAGSRQGFAGAGPKVNYTAGRFQLYVPRYTGLDTDRFDAAIDCLQGVIPMGRLESVRQKGGRTTRPNTLDLTSVGVSPMEHFKLTIDGETVFENRPRQVLFFNNIGLPMNKPVGDVYAIHLPSVSLRLVRAEVMEDTVKDGLAITRLDVSVAGGVWVDDSVPEAPVQAEEAPVEEPKPVKAKKAPVKRVRVKGSFTVAPGSRDAEVLYGGDELQLYPATVNVRPTVEGCDASECTLSLRSESGDIIAGPVQAAPSVDLDAEGAFGPATVVLEREGKALAESKVFLIPGFECSYEGKGDIVDDPVVEFSFAGISGTRNMYDDDAYGPFEHEGVTFYIRWAVPAVTYDLGNGPVRYAPVDVDIADLKADRMRITVKGARKKSLFFGGEKGKKTDVTPEWDGEYYDVELEPIREEVYSHPSSTYCFYITVNSFPNRRFMRIVNPVRLKARFEDGCVVADVDASAPECVCRLHCFNGVQRDVPLVSGENRVPVDGDVIEAEVLEMDGQKVRLSVPVSVRNLPFLQKDAMGDLWLYVSRSKRIPLPAGLIVDGKPVNDAIKAWHERIVRMNPELRNVTLAMMQRAFSDYGE